mmetsp:Transcript_95144/g.306531  ORF Transcript_95144/g.306531 Transcript_95144/m.306531 type:complete len:251 (-) Transcript_95144:818-1570(-)
MMPAAEMQRELRRRASRPSVCFADSEHRRPAMPMDCWLRSHPGSQRQTWQQPTGRAQDLAVPIQATPPAPRQQADRPEQGRQRAKQAVGWQKGAPTQRQQAAHRAQRWQTTNHQKARSQGGGGGGHSESSTATAAFAGSVCVGGWAGGSCCSCCCCCCSVCCNCGCRCGCGSAGSCRVGCCTTTAPTAPRGTPSTGCAQKGLTETTDGDAGRRPCTLGVEAPVRRLSLGASVCFSNHVATESAGIGRVVS